MESTVIWKPVFNLLEGAFDVILVNASHGKQVPGRKTDVNDAEWLAELLVWLAQSELHSPPSHNATYAI
ncbi:MAG: hypothetical protein IPG51_18305 [Chloroflexi bacterium]|nr:hypothetical protein [Chloroflexota bacterium]